MGKKECFAASGERFSIGVVAGKFYPFHNGHNYLISEAGKRCDKVVVLVAFHEVDLIPGRVRAAWIKTAFADSKFEVVLVNQDELKLGDNDSKAWADFTLAQLGKAPGAVFTSEDYGDVWADFLGCKHVLVDKARVVVPTSGSKIRKDPLGNLDYMTPTVRAAFVRRVCVLGAESTGKTTLTKALAAEFNTLWAPEYGHAYNVFREKGTQGWESGEFTIISKTQSWLEDYLAGYANKVLFCDTDAFVTAVFHQEYMGYSNPLLWELAAARKPYDLFILTDIDTGFTQDEFNLRSDGEHRARMHDIYSEYVLKSGVPVIHVTGSTAERIVAVKEAINLLISNTELSEHVFDLRSVEEMFLDQRLAEGL